MTVLAAVEEPAGAWLAGTALLDVFRSVMVPRAANGRLRLGPVVVPKWHVHKGAVGNHTWKRWMAHNCLELTLSLHR